MFIDRVKVKVKAGDGGRGCMSFRREKFVPRGGPDGGDGGDGGSVVFRVDEGETTLISLHSRPFYEAGRGEHGRGKDQTGARGRDVVCRVPPGTLLQDLETEELLCDLTEPGQEFIVAHGGRGGRGNARFVTSTRQAPRHAEPGQPGESRTLRVELKMIAQVGLVGFPNAGKSTLIRALTHAHARVGEYPFTTLSPVLGALTLPDGEKIIIADIPGLIEGAHEGAGLGTDFLRHVERTRLLVFVVDISPQAGPGAEEALRVLRGELRQYRSDLLERPWIVACNKADLLDSEDRDGWETNPARILAMSGVEAPQAEGDSAGVPCCVTSGLKGQGLDRLVDLIEAEYKGTVESGCPKTDAGENNTID